MTIQSFSYNGSDGSDGSAQDFVVPAAVTSIRFKAYGARGKGNTAGDNGLAGLGGYIDALVTVTPGETLKVYVGGNYTGSSSGVGGWNGGAAGGDANDVGAAGGGATDIRRTPYALADRLAIAGGGGGRGNDSGGVPGNSNGGDGGYTSGDDGTSNFPADAGGRGGTQSAGGAAGGSAAAGTLGTGGKGYPVTFIGGAISEGGGGGGGLYGGGGGGETGGGGGGSSGVPSGILLANTTGANSTHGSATIEYNADSEGGSALAIPALTSDVPFLQSNDRYQLVVCVDQGTSTTTAEFRHWYAGPPLWSEAVAGDSAYPTQYTLDEDGLYTPGSLELPFQSFKGEADIQGVYVEFNTRPTSISESIATTYPIGFTASVEGYGVSGYSRTVTGSLTTGVHTSTTRSYTSSAGYQADEPWPNTRGEYIPIQLGQRVKKARVILSDIHLVEIVNVQLIGTILPNRDL